MSHDCASKEVAPFQLAAHDEIRVKALNRAKKVSSLDEDVPEAPVHLVTHDEIRIKALNRAKKVSSLDEDVP